MPRGGHRDKAGRKKTWNNSETKTIRVPKVFAEQLLEIARLLDSGITIDIETKSNQKPIENITEPKRRTDNVIKSNDNVTKSVDGCPNCGFYDWKIEGYRTLKSGEKKQKRRCKNCGRVWSVSMNAS